MGQSTRNQDRIELTMEPRQLAGIVGGSLVTLAAVFALGVGFGRQLATAPVATASSDLSHLDAHPAAPAVADTGFTFHESLLKGEATVVAAKPPAPAPPPELPRPAAAPIVAAPIVVESAVVLAAPVVEAKPIAEVPALKPIPAPVLVAASKPVEAPVVAKVAEKPVLLAAAAKPVAKPVVPAVAVKPVEPAKRPAEPPPARAEPEKWCVQFGASPARAEADKLAATLLDYGYPSYVAVADIPAKGRYYRVRIGHFAGKEQADKLRAEVVTKHKLAGLVMPAR